MSALAYLQRIDGRGRCDILELELDVVLRHVADAEIGGERRQRLCGGVVPMGTLIKTLARVSLSTTGFSTPRVRYDKLCPSQTPLLLDRRHALLMWYQFYPIGA